MINFLFAFVLSLVTLVLLLKTPLGNLALDQPNERSLHSQPVSRTGGLAIMIPVLIMWLFIGASKAWIWIPALLLGVSLLDDIYSLSVLKRLGVQVFASFIFIKLQIPNIPWLEFLIILLATIWITNLYNFMDGSDGLAGGMTLFGFGAYAVTAYSGENTQLAVMCAVVSSASLAFLIFNFYPAKIFMGDAGSIPLGFLAGAIGIYGWKIELWPVWFPVLVFSPFIVDATATLIKRLIKRESFWKAHRDHYYQRLVRMEWGHGKTAITEYVLMLLVAVSAVALTNKSLLVISFSLGAWIAVYAILMLAIDCKWRIKSPKGL